MSQSTAAMDEFLSECEEIVQRVSVNLQKIEKSGVSPKLVDELYRDTHTMKGSAQLFGFKVLGRIAHAMEASLDPVRKHKLVLPPAFLDVLFKGLDLVDRVVKALRSQSNEAAFVQETEILLALLVERASQLVEAEYKVGNEPPSQINSLQENFLGSDRGEALKAPEPSVVIQMKAQNTEELISESPAPQASAHEPEAQAATASTPAPNTAQADTTIRVQVELLDKLMNLVGELVLVRNQVLQYQNKHDELEFINLAQTMDVVTTELQNDVMRTRMQPIGNVVTKFQRVARDLARDLGKKIDLTIEGAETELDKTLLEAIKDPLTHIVRNSCDHGIETIEERKKSGKPDSGHLLIRSFHEGGQVIIEISDDGKGIDQKRVKQKAVEKALITQEQAAKMTEREVCQLVFLPGFSTAKQVTSVSGRGVGMDVVKTNIEKIGGSVEIASTKGKGTTIRLKIPLTLAIVPAMLIRSGSERFAIPQVKLVELVRIDPSEGKEKIEFLQSRPMYRLRGNLLPLVLLNVALNSSSEGAAALSDSVAHIVVLNAEGEYFGLVVDEILDTADIVVKPLGTLLKNISAFSGATIMGDGTVALILDITGIAESAHIDVRSQRKTETFMDAQNRDKKKSADSQEFLLVRTNAESIHAIPLCLVSRLEEFPGKEIEASGMQRVVQYRNAILPLIDIDTSLSYVAKQSELEKMDRVSTVVVQRSGRNFGLVVKEILDVITTEEGIDDSIRDRDGLLGNLLFREQVIVVIDALGLIEQELTRLGKPAEKTRTTVEDIRKHSREQKLKRVRVLYAEDVAFFRKHVSKVLLAAGHEVQVAEDGAAALRLLENSADGDFNLILSDIEMPNLNGLQFAQEIRKNPRFKHLPVIALTTRFRQKDIEEGQKAGFNVYLEKLNAEKLLSSIEVLMNAAAQSTAELKNEANLG